MISILVVFEKPAGDTKTWIRLSENLRELSNAREEGIQVLGENCLLLATDKGLGIFGVVLRAAEGNVPYKYAVLNTDVEWLSGEKVHS